jgi:hypothetical protein
MNSDDIYKFIGYAVVIIFGFYIVSKSLNFQFKIIEGMTEQEKRDKDKQDKENERKRTGEENANSESINKLIREINIRNNNNLKYFKIINKSLIEEYSKLTNNYITKEKINIFNIINNKNKNITFSSIINDLKNKCEKIESLKKSSFYLSETNDGDLEEDVKDEPESKFEESSADKTKRQQDETKLMEKLKALYEEEIKYNNDDIAYISKTEKELQNSYLNLLISYTNEEKIYISDILLDIGEDLTTYNNKMNQIENHNINISVLKKTESILTELFGGSVSGGSSVKGKKKGKEKKEKEGGLF